MSTASLTQPSSGAAGSVLGMLSGNPMAAIGGGSGPTNVNPSADSNASASLNSSGSRYTLGGGDLTLGGLSSSNMSLLIIGAAIVAAVFLYRKGR